MEAPLRISPWGQAVCFESRYLCRQHSHSLSCDNEAVKDPTKPEMSQRKTVATSRANLRWRSYGVKMAKS